MDLLSVIGWPVLDRIGGIVSPHGIGIAAGYLLGSIFMLREGRKRGLSEEHMGTILLWALLGAIFGARFFYVVAHFGDFDSLADLFRQIGFDERVHKEESILRMGEPRFR